MAMKLRVFFLLLFALPAQAQAAVQAPFYEAVRGKQVVHVMGTLHVSRPHYFPLRPVIESAFKQSAGIYLELDPVKPETARLLAENMVCSTPCLRQELNDAEWARLKENLGNSELAIRQIEMMRPWAAAVVLTLADFMAIGMQPDQSVDNYLAGLASGKMRVEGLEMPQEQLRLFTGMPVSEQKEMLVEWLNMRAEERLAYSRELVGMWEAGDADALYAWHRETGKKLSKNPALEENFNRKFITERNHRLVDRLLSRIGKSDGPHFLAVGALHLGGPEGVLALLKRRGYTIKAR